MHYSDVIMGAIGLKSPASPLFTQPFIQAQIQEKSKLRVTGLCVGNITSSNFWRHAGYRCPGRESLLSNDKLQLWIECRDIWCHIYQLNYCIALQPINKLGNMGSHEVDNLLAPLLLPSGHTPVPKTSSRQRFQDVQTLARKTSIALS